jgi:flagellar FliJ protein
VEGFRFNLQKVLDFKMTIEEKKKNEFVKALKELTIQDNKLKELMAHKERVKKDLLNFKTVFDYQNYVRYMDLLDKRIEHQKDKVNKCEKILEEKKQELIKSTSDRKVLEMLKEKALNENNLEISRKEQRLNDDFALFSYVRYERR